MKSFNTFVTNLLIRVESFLCNFEENDANRLEAFLLTNSVSERTTRAMMSPLRNSIASYRAELADAWKANSTTALDLATEASRLVMQDRASRDLLRAHELSSAAQSVLKANQ